MCPARSSLRPFEARLLTFTLMQRLVGRVLQAVVPCQCAKKLQGAAQISIDTLVGLIYAPTERSVSLPPSRGGAVEPALRHGARLSGLTLLAAVLSLPLF